MNKREAKKRWKIFSTKIAGNYFPVEKVFHRADEFSLTDDVHLTSASFTNDGKILLHHNKWPFEEKSFQDLGKTIFANFCAMLLDTKVSSHFLDRKPFKNNKANKIMVFHSLLPRKTLKNLHFQYVMSGLKQEWLKVCEFFS